MERRRWLATLAGVAGTLAGCSAPLASGAGPSPVVVDHVRGRVTVTETSRTHVLGGGSRIEATVTNAGHPATVDVTLYWVPELGLDPEGVSDRGLRQLGYVSAVTERLQVGRGAEQTVTFEASQPSDAVGYYVRADNWTFGALVENRGDAGRVRAELVDTTDMSAQAVVARQTVAMEAGAQRPVTFVTSEAFESFRVDVAPADAD